MEKFEQGVAGHPKRPDDRARHERLGHGTDADADHGYADLAAGHVGRDVVELLGESLCRLAATASQGLDPALAGGHDRVFGRDEEHAPKQQQKADDHHQPGISHVWAIVSGTRYHHGVLRSNRVVQALERNPDALWSLLARHVPSGVYDRVAGVTLTSIPYPHPLFNFASLGDVEPGEEDRAIRAARDFFQERETPWFWLTGPATRPAGLSDALLRAGFTHSHDAPGMGLDLRGYRHQEPGGDLREVDDEPSLRRWLEAVIGSFEMQPDLATVFLDFHRSIGWRDIPIRYFFAEEEGRPVAAAMLFYGSGVAGIYCVGTLPDARRKGFGERLMHASLRAAIEDGYDVAVLHSSRMGLPLYERLGFREFCRIGYYVPPAD